MSIHGATPTENDDELFKTLNSRVVSYDEKQKIMRGLTAEQKKNLQQYSQQKNDEEMPKPLEIPKFRFKPHN